MKSSLFNTLLNGVLATSLVLSIWYSYLYYSRSKQLIQEQAEIQRYQQTHQWLNLLINDTAEYSRRDPASFTPIFDSIGLKINRTPAPANGAARPAAK